MTSKATKTVLCARSTVIYVPTVEICFHVAGAILMVMNVVRPEPIVAAGAMPAMVVVPQIPTAVEMVNVVTAVKMARTFFIQRGKLIVRIYQIFYNRANFS